MYGFSIDDTAQLTSVSGPDSDTKNTIHAAAWSAENGNALWGGAADDAGKGMLTAVNSSFPRLSGGIHAARPFVASGIESGDWYNTTLQLDNSAVIGCMGAISAHSLCRMRPEHR